MFIPAYLPVITILTVVAVVAMPLIMLFCGSEQRTRSMDDVYARRERARRAADDAG